MRQIAFDVLGNLLEQKPFDDRAVGFLDRCPGCGEPKIPEHGTAVCGGCWSGENGSGFAAHEGDLISWLDSLDEPERGPARTIDIPDSTTMTPWGRAQTATRYAHGLFWYSTASHGGFKVSLKRRRRWPPALGLWGMDAGPGWYEEDVDASIVVLAEPDLFSGRETYHAIEIARSGLAPWCATVRAWLDETDAGRRARGLASAWKWGHAEEFERGGSFGDASGLEVSWSRIGDGLTITRHYPPGYTVPRSPAAIDLTPAEYAKAAAQVQA